MLKILIASVLFVTSIYTLTYTDIDGNTQNFSASQGKKILLVNIATGSELAGQLGGLQQLHQLHHDSLDIIAFPSNSFGHEGRTNAEIKQFCQATYGTTFKLAAKGNVAGTGLLPIYNWLGQASQNGIMDNTVVGDFQKFLIDKNGQLIGVFAPEIAPMDSTITKAITEN